MLTSLRAIAPLIFAIALLAAVDERLYLDYSLEIRDRWDADRDAYVQRASAAWPNVRRSLAH